MAYVSSPDLVGNTKALRVWTLLGAEVLLLLHDNNDAITCTKTSKREYDVGVCDMKLAHTYPAVSFLSQDTDALDDGRARIIDAIQECLYRCQ